MKRHAKAPAAGSSMRQGNRLGSIVRGALAPRASSPRVKGSGASSNGRLRGATACSTRRRGAFSLACLSVLGAAAFIGGAPSAGAFEGFPGQGFLPDDRAWELTSPESGKDVLVLSSLVQAAPTESPGLPMAVNFSSLGGFGDVEGMALTAGYISERTGVPGTSGWSVHGITPPQEAKTYEAAVRGFPEPRYEPLTPDLTRGIYRSLSSLPGTSANAWQVPNLYLRDNLRTPGPGSYQLLTDSFAPQPPLSIGLEKASKFDGASADYEHIVFESALNLTADAGGANVKLYKSDGGLVRLVRAHGTCPGLSGAKATAPCSMAGLGGTGIRYNNYLYTSNVISADGSRANFTSPTGGESASIPQTGLGVVSKLYQLDDQGTAAGGDDAVIQLNMSEKPSPEPARAALYETASTDGDRVFFFSEEQLTEAAGGGLYMWDRQDEDETQELAVDASGGDFKLTAHAQPSYGSGQLTEGSTTVAMTENPGSFTIGQTIEGAGIPAGTTVTEVGTFKNGAQQKIVISKPATETATTNLNASFEVTTAPLPWNATAAEVQVALEGLSLVGSGNVSVTGGPGASSPFEVEFTGALAGVNVMPLTTAAGGLTGGASTASVTTSNDVRNLELLDSAGHVIGASDDGHRVYFASSGDIWLWQDALPGPNLLHVDTVNVNDLNHQTIVNSIWLGKNALRSRVTPDGRNLFFFSANGGTLEAYVYRADTSTPSEPDLVCVSCDPANPGAPGEADITVRLGAGIAAGSMYLSRPLSEGGLRAFFHTPKPLVPDDTNGVMDVYEYDRLTGEVHLISSGTDPSPSFFMDASADGSDVFFITRAQLSAWDDDQAFDLYDARVGGGFPEPPIGTAPCNGADSCRGPVAGAPPPPPIGSGSVSGPGNPERPCSKGARRVRKAGKVRCVKKHRRRHKRHASNDRRAGK